MADLDGQKASQMTRLIVSHTLAFAAGGATFLVAAYLWADGHFDLL